VPKEIEVKLPVSAAKFEELLARVDVRLPRLIEAMDDRYFDLGDRPYALRIRTTTCEDQNASVTTTSITLKARKGALQGGVNVREEIEPSISRSEVARFKAMFEALGFPEYARVEKRRESVTVGHCVVSFDLVQRLGTFIEVEAKSADEATARAAIAEVVAGMGLSHVAPEPRGYLDLILEAQGGPQEG
jgi:predicted adenylyl cyclase CyaB